MSRFLVILAVVCVQLPIDMQVKGEPNPEPGPIRSKGIGSKQSHQELLTKYLLSRLLGQGDLSYPPTGVLERREDQDSESSYVYPRSKDPLQKLLDHAKANIDVIDFRNPGKQYFEEDHLRFPRQPGDLPPLDEDLTYNEDQENPQRSSPSDSVPIFLPFPGTEPNRRPRQAPQRIPRSSNQFSMPLTALGKKEYYLGIFFKANWYKAEQYCRFHGMHLASINSDDEQRNLEEHITSFGMGNEHFWSSGTDQAEEGKFFWMSTGKPLTFENWNAGEPNNFKYENGEGENCLELWNRDGKGLKWNDTPCSFESYFVCEV
eukprot:TRINITY_DN7261_c0_g1_i2.p1 TRINITY_DN7261_c0_g1~~TRINITY_DN7261_c0_g1_i2.p1  ORF type:complete len:318 (-),score=48.46 TRINITY_DN7261_c0_g1_i2:279-1232(-)